jgi:uncharacterized tellurite resistance protein B-like protein
LAWANRAALADRHIDGGEYEALQKIARRRGVSREQTAMMIEAARRGELEISEPADRGQAVAWIAAMADVALCDGKIDDDELGLMREVGATVALSHHDVSRLVKRRRTQLYREARAAIARNRRKRS